MNIVMCVICLFFSLERLSVLIMSNFLCDFLFVCFFRFES